jgi:hypothetical protein
MASWLVPAHQVPPSPAPFQCVQVGPEGFDDSRESVVFPISARTGLGVPPLQQMLARIAPLRPWCDTTTHRNHCMLSTEHRFLLCYQLYSVHCFPV